MSSENNLDKSRNDIETSSRISLFEDKRVKDQK